MKPPTGVTMTILGVETDVAHVLVTLKPTVHRSPIGDNGTMPCCERTPFAVSVFDRMTTDPAAVTCRPER